MIISTEYFTHPLGDLFYCDITFWFLLSCPSFL